MGPKSVKKSTRKKFYDTALAEALKLPENPTLLHAWNLYRLSTPGCFKHCFPQPKSSNCRDNPYCLARIGLEKFEKLIKNTQTNHDKLRERMVARDHSKQPCGLQNTGNFCYVNSFLQIWFNDPEFRQIVFDWQPSERYVSPPAPKMDVQGVMDSLKQLYYYMQTSPFDNCDVSPFTKILRLGNEQQDAQEFTLCFFDALDRNLANHPNGEGIRRRITRRFQGTVSQSIRCTCGRDNKTVSIVSSLQLSIENSKTLSEVIAKYFADETLEDFRCDVCGSTGNVTRVPQFEELPTVLMLQLNRYVFDASGRNKKLKSAIQFPRELSGSTLKPGDPAVAQMKYDLCAVMIHEGDNTYCGHYFDIIKRVEDGKWYQYNDEQVTESRPPGVEVEKAGGVSKPPVDLRACYGLVYRRRQNGEMANRVPKPTVSHEWDAQIKGEFKSQAEGDINASLLGLEQVRKRNQVVADMLDDLEMKPLKENEYATHPDIISFLPLDLISDIIHREFERVERKKQIIDAKHKGLETELKDSESEASTSAERTIPAAIAETNGVLPNKRGRVRVGTNRPFPAPPPPPQPSRVPKYRIERDVIGKQLGSYSMVLCTHGKIDLDQVVCGDVKVVSAAAADALLDKYGVKLTYSDNIQRKRLTPRGNDICLECIKQLKREASFKEELGADEKLVKKILSEEKTRCSIKNTRPRPDDHLWVSKKCLVNYKRLALREMEYQQSLQENTGTLTFCTDITEEQSTSNGTENRAARKRTRSGTGGDDVNGGRKVAKEEVEGIDVIMEVDEEEDGEKKEEKGREFDVSWEVLEDVLALVCKDTREDVKVNQEEAEKMEKGTVRKRQKMEEDDNDTGDVLQPIAQNGTNAKREEKMETDDVKQENGNSVNGDGQSPGPSDTVNGCDRAGSSGGSEQTEQMEAVCFNSELRCAHGGVGLEEWRLSVTPEEWETLSKHFGERNPVHCSAPLCQMCFDENEMRTASADYAYQRCQTLNQLFPDLIKSFEKRVMKPAEMGTLYTHLVCNRFLQKLRSLYRISKSRRGSSQFTVCQECFFCEAHSVPFITLDPEELEGLAYPVPVTTEEWKIIVDVMATNQQADEVPPIEVKLLEGGQIGDFCFECHDARVRVFNDKRYVYENETIFVKLQGDTENEAPTVSLGGYKPQPSTRRTAAKSLFRIKMSSYETVRDLKVKLIKHTKQSPADQLIYGPFDGELLEDFLTMESARVEPNKQESPLVLVVQTSSASTVPASDEARELERGFTDTALAH